MNSQSPTTLPKPTRMHFAAVAGVSLLLAGLGLHAEWFSYSTADWDAKEAQVTASERRSPDARGPDQAYPVFTYRYARDGVVYEGSRYHYRGGQEAAAERHAPGDIITIRVDPRDARRSVVSRELGWWDRIQLPLGVILLMATVFKWRSVYGPGRSPSTHRQ